MLRVVLRCGVGVVLQCRELSVHRIKGVWLFAVEVGNKIHELSIDLPNSVRCAKIVSERTTNVHIHIYVYTT